MKVKLLCAGLFLLCLSLWLTGCSSPQGTPAPAPNPPNTQNQEPAHVDTSPAASQDAVTQLLAKGSGIREYSYTLSIEGGSTRYTCAVWLNDTKLRTETVIDGRKVVTVIARYHNVTSYQPDQKTGSVVPYAEYQGWDDITPKDYSASIDNTNYEVVGTDMLDNTECLLVLVSAPDGAFKGWLNTELGLFIKVETESNGTTSVVEFRDIKTGPGSAPEALFKIPGDIRIVS